ncbi:Innexin inx3, partial [Cichlidogyrus casuarinus]
LSSIMEVACDIEMIKDPESRRSNVTYVARHIEDALNTQREYRIGCSVKFRHCLAKNCCLWFGKRYGNYLVFLYISIKLLYMINVIGQFFLMDQFLGSESQRFFGVNLLYNLSRGVEWSHSGNFPRITLCDFTIRKVAGNLHSHTVQCVLPINMLNEKIFIFLWFWYVLVAAVCFSSFFHWFHKCTFRLSRIQFIRKFLKLREALEPGNKKKSYSFVDDYLRPDGVFILRLVAQNAGELVASEIVERMWQIFKQHQSNPTIVPLQSHSSEEKTGNRMGKKPTSRSPVGSHQKITFQPPPLPPSANGSYKLPRNEFPPPLPPHPSSSAPIMSQSSTGPGSSSSTTSSVQGSGATSSGSAVLPMTLRPEHKRRQPLAAASAPAKAKNGSKSPGNEEDTGDFV